MDTFIQVNIVIPNVPGSIAKVTDKLRAANVNIIALSCTEGKPSSVFHIVVDDTETAKLVLQPEYKISTSEVLSFRMKNKPGAIASIGRVCAGAGLNIRNIYATTLGKEAAVFATFNEENLPKAKEMFKKWTPPV
jgi:hypothetical protein